LLSQIASVPEVVWLETQMRRRGTSIADNLAEGCATNADAGRRGAEPVLFDAQGHRREDHRGEAHPTGLLAKLKADG